jgi:hypothetical protein
MNRLTWNAEKQGAETWGDYWKLLILWVSLTEVIRVAITLDIIIRLFPRPLGDGIKFLFIHDDVHCLFLVSNFSFWLCASECCIRCTLLLRNLCIYDMHGEQGACKLQLCISARYYRTISIAVCYLVTLPIK